MQMRLERGGWTCPPGRGCGAWLEGEDPPGGAEPSAVEQHSQTVKRTSLSSQGDSIGDRKGPSQLSLKHFTWEAGKHLLGAPSGGQGSCPRE